MFYPAFRIDTEGQRVEIRREKDCDVVKHRHGHDDVKCVVHILRRQREVDVFYAQCGGKGIGQLEFLPASEITCAACLEIVEKG